MQLNSPRNSEKPPGESEAAQRAYELGCEYERVYGACSQCTTLAIMDALGKRDGSVFKAAFGFAGGIGSLSKTCGALAAGVMAIGLTNIDHLSPVEPCGKGRLAAVVVKDTVMHGL